MNSFGKRHYGWFAEFVRNFNGGYEDRIAAMAGDLADLFEIDNPNFDRNRFFRACEAVFCPACNRPGESHMGEVWCFVCKKSCHPDPWEEDPDSPWYDPGRGEL